MPKKTTPATTPIWPYPEVVKMTAHAGSGQWRKRFKGKDYWFGSLADPDQALARWRAEWPRITAGLPRFGTDDKPREHVTVGQLVVLFVDAKLRAHKAGDLEWVTYLDYQDTGKFISATLGVDRPATSLGPGDFTKLVNAAKGFSLSRRRKIVIHTRSLFKWAMEARQLSGLPEYGPDLKSPPVKMQRRAKREGGARHLSPAEVKQLLNASGQSIMRPLILLAMNGGYGNTDLSELRKTALDVRPGWLIQPRHKTEAERFVPLWPETIDAIAEARCPGPLLLTNRDGLPLVRRGTDEIGEMSRALFNGAGLTNRSFYDLRRTFATLAAEVADEHASRLVMGHVIDGVHAGYIQTFPRRRLYRVVFHVRERLGL